MGTYRDTVKEIESSVKTFIDRSAGSLRSAEGAFEFLLKLRQVQTQSAIIQQVLLSFVLFLIVVKFVFLFLCYLCLRSMFVHRVAAKQVQGDSRSVPQGSRTSACHLSEEQAPPAACTQHTHCGRQHHMGPRSVCACEEVDAALQGDGAVYAE